ncbi:oligosaccharide flippase family protein [Levilactobacillus suantsaiihabitans]|uniref:oligosaccharide flippase family protein n=1 Tax=Levilactobacillus suantsaiihabitans TaxID=2487722 RepID=UPI001436B0E2|nr:polysaccharide biosynthesis C-terminal domain-containing protein [Levilactobacillus suantsaiihabitans]
MKIIKNYLYNSSYQLFLIILPIITLPYVARTLGPSALGVNSYTYSVTSYFTMFAILGTTTYAQREVAYLKDDKLGLTRFFVEVELLNIGTSVISYIGLLIVILFLSKYQISFLIYSITIIANIFDVSWLFMGTGRFAILAIRNFIVKIISVLLIFSLVKDSSDLYIYILINVLSILVSNLTLWPYIKKDSLLFLKKQMIPKLRPFRHLRGTLALFIPQISITLYTVLNKVLLGAMGKIREGSYFDSADKIIRLSFTMLVSLSTVLMPVVANEIAKKNRQKVEKLLSQSLQFSLCIAFPLFGGLVGIAERLVPLFLGNQYDKVILLLQVQGFIIIPMAIANVIGNQYLVPSRQTKKLNVSIFGGSIFNILISVPLIETWGAFGASVAIACSETLVTTLQVFQVRNELHFYGIGRDVLKYTIATCGMYLFIRWLQLVTVGWISIIACIILGIVFYFGLLIILRANIVNTGRKIISNKFKI